MTNKFRILMAGLALCLLVPFAAAAQTQIATQTVTIVDDNVPSRFSVEKIATVFDDGGGIIRYVYTIRAVSGDPICGFRLLIPDVDVLTASFNPGTGVDPVAVNQTPSGVEYRFGDATNPLTCLGEPAFVPPLAGSLSSELVITSNKGPGMVGDFITVSLNSISGIDEPGLCLGPVAEIPAGGEPMACTIGFWKNRSEGKSGLLQFFPDEQFDPQLLNAALALSGGVFTSADGTGATMTFDDLVFALQSKGKRTPEERARQQLAATLLNLAAGSLFLDNGKCQLFFSNLVGSNACVDLSSVEAAVNFSIADILNAATSGQDAQECLDDLNNGISVTQ